MAALYRTLAQLLRDSEAGGVVEDILRRHSRPVGAADDDKVGIPSGAPPPERSSRPLRLEIPGAARHRVFPQIGAVVIEDQSRLGGRGEPVPAGEFALELTRSPARVAERKEALHRAPIMPDV